MLWSLNSIYNCFSIFIYTAFIDTNYIFNEVQNIINKTDFCGRDRIYLPSNRLSNLLFKILPFSSFIKSLFLLERKYDLKIKK